MSEYTQLLSYQAETLSPDDDHYEAQLLETAAMFRSFDLALTEFIKEHGYSGTATDGTAKAKFIRQRFKNAKIRPPRNINDWFSPKNKKLHRETLFQICFAFGLDVDETNDFFRCVRLERGFDCHTVSEAVYYFCMKNGLCYGDAQRIIDRLPKIKTDKTLPNQKVVYTGTLLESIDRIATEGQLIDYITENIRDFRYNNATIIRSIRGVWNKITKEDGLAEKEGEILNRFNRFEDRSKRGKTDTRSDEVITAEIQHQKQNVRIHDFVIAKEGSSTWTVFCQILGLTNEDAKKYDRSLTPVLTANALMPVTASYCFPNQHSIDKVLRGELGEHEVMRKLLILLVFYSFWARKVIQHNDAFFSARITDSESCVDSINQYLRDSGYPDLYAGNPYDWLFLWSLNDEHPLEAFRSYMGEVFAVKSEETD